MTIINARPGSKIWAIASLCLGIISVFGGMCFVIPPILAIIFGFIALRQAKSADGRVPGRLLAITGIVLGTLALLVASIWWYSINR